MKTVLTTLALVATTIYSLGQGAAGAVKGTIHDENGEAIPYAVVAVEMGDNDMKALTDENGRFTVKPLNTGSYILRIMYPGYDTARFKFDVDPDEITFLNDLVIEPTMSKGVTVVANKLIDPEETSKISLGLKELKTSAVLRDPQKLVASMTSDIKLLDGNLYFRGSRSDGIVQFVDGMKLQPGMPGLPGRAIGNVSVYTGGIPAKYGDTTSGVIVMETKSYFQLYYARMAGD